MPSPVEMLRSGCLCLILMGQAVSVAALDPEKGLHEFALRSWGANQGLPQMSVEALVQTRDGYLWVGTQEGVVRFDGAGFTSFDRSAGEEGAPHHVTSLAESRDGRLLAGSFGGASYRTQSPFAPVPGLEPFSDQKVFCFALGEGTTLWVGTSAGGARLEGSSLTRFDETSGLPSAMVRAVSVDHSGAVWLGTDLGLVRIASGKPVPVPGFPRVQVLSLAAAAGGGMWIGTAEGLAHWNGGSLSWQGPEDGLPHRVVNRLLVDSSGALWAGTVGGLGRYWKGRWSTLSKQDGLVSQDIRALAEDHEGSLWIGTLSGGLSALVEGRVRVLGPRDGLADDVVYTLAGDAQGNVFGGTESGEVFRIEAGSGRIASLGSARAWVRALLVDASGNLWMGTEQGLFRHLKGEVRRFAAAGMPRDSIRTVYETRGGELWLGTERSGAVRLSGGRAEILDVSRGLPSNEVRAMVEDREGNLWIGTVGGLVSWKGGIERVYTRRDGLAHDFVRCLFEDSEGALWVGTYGGGVSRFSAGRFLSLSTKQGLPSDAIFAILEDQQKDLWMSCNRGIFRVARRDLRAVFGGDRSRVEALHLDHEDGMLSAECNGGSPGAWRRPDGILLFPTLRGIVLVDPARLAEAAPPPPAVIEGVVVDGKELDLAAAGVLPPGTQRVEIRFSAISLRSSRRIQLFHRLLGFERGWAEAGTNRAVQYTRLSPGSYVFQLSTCGGDGRCSESEVSYAFRLEPRIHQEVWFFPLVGVVGLGAIGLLALLGVRRGVSRERELQRRIKEALAEIKVLSGLIPICAGCKKIREDSGYWTLVEDYLRRYSDVRFSHGLCPDCLRTLYPEFADAVLAENGAGGERPSPGGEPKGEGSDERAGGR